MILSDEVKQAVAAIAPHSPRAIPNAEIVERLEGSPLESRVEFFTENDAFRIELEPYTALDGSMRFDQSLYCGETGALFKLSPAPKDLQLGLYARVYAEIQGGL